MDIEKPVLFNCIKHHLAFICNRIDQIFSTADFDNLLSEITAIGNAQLDLYIGKLHPEEIANSLLKILNTKGIKDAYTYKRCLNRNNGYMTIRIGDGSEWVLRRSNSAEKYIHIHPARCSPETVRLSAATLKSAIVIHAWQSIHKEKELSLSTINEIRGKYLGLSPLKNLTGSKGLCRLIELIKNNPRCGINPDCLINGIHIRNQFYVAYPSMF